MQLKWKHLYEGRDVENRALFRRWLATGQDSDQRAWLRSERRSGRNHAKALKMHVPDDIDDVKDEAEEAAARSIYVFSYADTQERLADRGEPHEPLASHGTDWMDIAPETPRRAVRTGKAFIKKVESMNNLTISQLYWVAANMPGHHYSDPTPENFGHYLAAEALGHGVSWDDDHPDPEIKLPHWNYEV